MILKLFLLIFLVSCNVIQALDSEASKIDDDFFKGSSSSNNSNGSSSQFLTLRAAGASYYGEFSEGLSDSIINHMDPRSKVNTTDSFTKVEVGSGTSSHTCALSSAGKIFCWGTAQFGAMGDNGVITQFNPYPTEVFGGYSYTSFDLGGTHGCAIRDNGELYCWGRNNRGQLGDGGASGAQSYIPVKIGTDTDWTQVSTSGDSSCALKTNGDLFCWGAGSFGQVGDNGGVDRNIPIFVLAGLKKVFAGGSSTCAIDLDDDLHCWGRNVEGNLGNGNKVDQLSPVEVDTTRDWIDVLVSYNFTCAVSSSSELFCSGIATQGEFGSYTQGSTHDLGTSFIQVLAGTNWKSIREGGHPTCGLDNLDKLYCWSSNASGSIGTGITDLYNDVPQLLSGREYIDVSAGYFHVCAIEKISGSLYCWGSGGSGKIGSSTDLGLKTNFISKQSSIDYKLIRSGREYSCGIDNSDRLYCWGRNSNGQLGLGDTAFRISAVEVDSSKRWRDVAVSFSSTCAVTTSGDAYCWGGNSTGVFGNNSTTSSFVPMVVSGSLNFDKISVSWFGAACGVTFNNEIYCWGKNADGQLGQGNSIDSLVPVQVETDTDWVDVTTAEKSTCGLKTDGRVFCWGEAGGGQLGSGSTTDVELPVASGIASAISLGAYKSGFCSLQNDGSISCWGYGGDGENGNGVNSSELNPVSISSAESFKKLFSSPYCQSICGITVDDKAFCWGSNKSGNLGNGQSGSFEYSNVPVEAVPGAKWDFISPGCDFTLGITR